MLNTRSLQQEKDFHIQPTSHRFFSSRSQFEQKAILKPADLPCQLGRIELFILLDQFPLDLAPICPELPRYRGSVG